MLDTEVTRLSAPPSPEGTKMPEHDAAIASLLDAAHDPELVGPSGLAIDLPGLYALPPAQQLLIHTFVGQWLAFFRCLQLGHKPDTPSEGVLTRVVGEFTLHAPEGDA